MKSNKRLWIIGIALIVFLILSIIVIKYIKNPTRLTLEEKTWINDNNKNVANITVLNDDKVFGNTGVGVFYDFLSDFSDNYNVKLNPVAYNTGDNVSGLYLGKSNKVSDKDSIFYKDHYVLIAKRYELIKNAQSLNEKTVGIDSANISYVSSYLNDVRINYTALTKKDLKTSLENGTVEYLLVPLMENVDLLLDNDYYVVYHFSDINYYYYLNSDDSVFSSILKKYMITWEDKLNDYLNDNLFNLFVTELKLTGTDVADLQNTDYEYGLINNSPYEVLTGGNYGGIVAVYLQKFHDFSGVTFNFKKYSNYNKFVKAIEQGKVDLYFNSYGLNTPFNDIRVSMPINYDIIIRNDNNTVINSLASLQSKEIYVEENSLLSSLLSNSSIKINTYKNNKELAKLAKKDNIILIDHNVFEYYKSNKLNNYTSRFSGILNNEYSFKMKDNKALLRVFKKYVNLLDSKEMINEGLLNHSKTVKSGTILGTIAKYLLYIVIIVFIVVIYLYKRTRKITIIKRIKKEDKLKYIDQLTSLKNRNYLSENIDSWNNNNVYPQAVIVLDLNKVQQINDTLGYEEGDKQIKALANSLVKTQLDYTEIIRTDGNEFLVYMVGYSQKQVASYIHKLNKEFKKLPYDYGAEFGYSMITDDLKTIEDAINEAVEQMKKQKKEKSENEKEKEE